jgi:hypothetical protein
MKIKEQYKIRNISGERIVMIQGQYGADLTKIVSFNETAEWLWNQLIGRDFSVDQVAHLLVEHYEVEADQALSDSREWVDLLLKHKLLEP